MQHNAIATGEAPLFCPRCGTRSAEAVTITDIGWDEDTTTAAYRCAGASCHYTFSEVTATAPDEEPEQEWTSLLTLTSVLNPKRPEQGI